MNTNMMHEVLAESQAGRLIFPEVVRRLVEAGVESCFCDQATGQEAFYAREGKTPSKNDLPASPVAEEFFLIRLDRRNRRGPSGYKFTKDGRLRGRHVGCTMPPA